MTASSPLDDFDLETAAALREHLRVPGMGETTTRYFRDKLAMRLRAQRGRHPRPEFIHVLNYERLHDFMARVPAALAPQAALRGFGHRHQETQLA